jgi:uncharacterized damage-inducible protein DinB
VLFVISTQKGFMKKLLLGMAGLCLASTIFGQDAPSLGSIIAKHLQTSKSFTLAVIEKMPEDQLSFKASPAEMSFGEMANHIANGNYNYCAVAPGATPKKSAETSKAAIEQQVSASFDNCLTALKGMSDSDLMKMVGKAPRQVTAFERFWGAATHTAHHRAQLEVYLRLKGIAPPSYEF